MLNTRKKTYDLTKMAVMIALVYFATFFIKVPSLNGYTHLGDCMIFISVLVLGRNKGSLAGGIGAALADFLGGYMVWVIPTFFIKFIMGMIMGSITEKLLNNYKYGWIPGSIVGGIFQICAYTIVKIFLFGIGYALASSVTLTLQTVSGVIIAILLVSLLSKSGIINKLREV